MERKKPAFTRPRRLELDYQDRISSLMDQWLREPTADSLDGILEGLRRTISATEAERLARGMITAVARGDAASWRAASAEATQASRIHRLLREELNGPTGNRMAEHIRQNTALLRSIPLELRQEVGEYVTKRHIDGVRADVIAAELRRKVPRMAAYKIDMVARTQVATTATAISRSRSERLNLNWYEWLTSEDARVRRSHRIMDLVLVNWNDPPAPEVLANIRSNLGHYHAGNCPNCRCDANVLVSLSQVVWPHKVYWQGKIQRMQRREFAAIAGMAA